MIDVNTREMTMFKNIDEVQKLGRGNMEVAMKSFAVMSKGFQAIAAEIANYSKSSLEDHTAAMEKLMAAKTMQTAFEVQSEYVKTAYEAFIAQGSRIGELYAGLAKETCKPFELIIDRKTSTT
jgi:phasin family protein